MYSDLIIGRDGAPACPVLLLPSPTSEELDGAVVPLAEGTAR
jgi:hypothetical protein